MDADASEPGPPERLPTEDPERDVDAEADTERDVDRAPEDEDPAVPESFDVTEPTQHGGPVHHATGGDIGDGGD